MYTIVVSINSKEYQSFLLSSRVKVTYKRDCKIDSFKRNLWVPFVLTI